MAVIPPSVFRMACVAACVVLLGGCHDATRGTVRGHVTVAGRRLTEGRVVFRSETTTLDGPIDSEGRYRLTWRGSPQVPVGDYAVILLPPERRGAPDADAEEQSFPERLRTADTSGIRRLIAPGDATIDVNF